MPLSCHAPAAWRRPSDSGVPLAQPLLSCLGMTVQQILYFAVLVAAFALLVTERLRNDVVAVLIVLALAGTGLLSAREALSGFASEPAIVVAAIFVLSAALHKTGLADRLGAAIGRAAGGGYARAVAVIMSSVALLSAFTHHVTTTAVMLPVTLKLAEERGLAPSKLLIPLSFAASLGTTITIIGAPAFLIASAVLAQAGRPRLGIFSIAPIGLAISALGTAFMVLAGRFLLPDRKGVTAPESRFRLDDYFTELRIPRDSPLVGKTVAELEADDRYRVKVVGRLHDGGRRGPPSGDARVAADDVLLVRTSPEAIVALRDDPAAELRPAQRYAAGQPAAAGERSDDVAAGLVQVIVAPGSELIGRTLREIDFRRRYGAVVLGLWRQAGWLAQGLGDTRLREGDVLVIQGDDESLERLAADPGFLMMVPFHGEPHPRRKAPLAGAIMLATVVAASVGVPLEIAGVAGAAAMVLTACVTPAQAYRAIDPRIYVFISGAIPLGTAMEKTGASTLLAGWLQHLVGGWSQWMVLLVIFGVVAVVTQFMSDSATTALLAPVAVALARGLGQPPEPYVVTVAMAAVASFLTPIGHHGNLLVYGPGGYRFADFVRVGTPLTALAAVVVCLLAPMLWRTP